MRQDPYQEHNISRRLLFSRPPLQATHLSHHREKQLLHFHQLLL